MGIMSPQSFILLLVFVAFACLTLAVLEVAMTRSRWSRLNERLRPMYKENTVSSNSWFARFKRRVNRSEYVREVDIALKSADMKLSAFDWIAMQIGAFVLLMLLFQTVIIIQFPFNILVSWLVVILGAKQVISARQNKLSQELNKQLPELCRMVGSCIRAGLSLPQSFEMVAKELRAPAGPIFRGMSSELRLGTSMEMVLEKLEERVKSKDISIFVQTVNVQRKAGGNISQAMDHLSKTLDDRARINGEIRTQTAETKFVAVALLLMPLFMVLMFNLMFDGFLMPIFTLPGLLLLIVVIVLMAIGFYLIRKVTNVKV
ncbi:type II secretion system F family protein [Paenibacillus sp. strain BS8-2]